MNFNRLKFFYVAVLVSVAANGSEIAAAVIAYDNLNPKRVSPEGGFTLGAYSVGELKLAQRFTPAMSGQLSTLELSLAFTKESPIAIYPNVDELTLAVVPDENGKPGITQL